MSAPAPAYDGYSAGLPLAVSPGRMGTQEAGGCREEVEDMMEGAERHPCPTHPPAPGLSAHLGH